MENSVTPPKCPGCQQPLAPGRAQGLCPRCLLARAALATEIPGNTPAAEVPELSAVAAAFPQLDVLELVGRGGMGVVYKARQKSLNRLVALKLLAPERVTEPQFASRFEQEAQALAQLSHPNIVTIHDFGIASPPPTPSAPPPAPFYFLLMEFVDGVNLRQALQAGRFTPEQALAIVPPVCAALQFAHERGIVHRDIKPENLLLDKDGRIKIADFGIAKMLGAGGIAAAFGPPAEPGPAADPAVGAPPVPAATALTAAGTPHYMAPEQCGTPAQADHRADIYSLGVVLYELLTGELPGACLEPPSHKVQLDVRLDAIVLRALAVQPELRYATAAEFRTQLDSVAKPAAGPSAPETPEIPRLLKSSPGLLYRPEELDTAEGQFCVWKRRGQLLLDEQRLTLVRDGVQTVISLAMIRDVSVGQFPRSMNPVGADLLSVTFEEAGQLRRVLLAPMDGWFALPGTWNGRVADWAAALRNAVARVTGREPACTPREALPEAGNRPGVMVLMSLCYVIPAIVTFLVLTSASRSTSPGNEALRWVFVLTMAVAGMLGPMILLRRRSGGPQPASWTRWLGILVVLVGLVVGWLPGARREARARAEYQGVMVKSQVAAAQQADLRAQLAELETQAANSRDEEQRSRDQFKRSRYQRELDASIQRSGALERGLAQGVPRTDRSVEVVAAIPLLLGGAWLLLRRGSSAPALTKPRRWMQWLGGALLALGVPLGGLGVWMAIQVAQDSSWNPAPAEAFFAFVVWSGAAVSLAGGLILVSRARPAVAEALPAPSNSRLGWGLLVLGCLCPLVAGVYVTITPPTYRATMVFKVDDTLAWLNLPEFWRNSFRLNPALTLEPVKLSRMFMAHGDASTPTEAERLLNDAFRLVHSDSLGSKLEVIDQSVTPRRPIRPNIPLALALGVTGVVFMALPGLRLVRNRIVGRVAILLSGALGLGLMLAKRDPTVPPPPERVTAPVEQPR